MDSSMDMRERARILHFWTYAMWWRLFWQADPFSQDLETFPITVRNTWWKA